MDQPTPAKRPKMQLSTRLGRYVHALASGLEASIKDRTNPALIDLALAENRVAQKEVLGLYKASLKRSLRKSASSLSRMIIKMAAN